MATYKSEKYVWNSTNGEWDLYYDNTSADNIVETSGYKVLTALERTMISEYLVAFNAAYKLLRLNEDGKVPSDLIDQDFDDYLKRDGSNAMTGWLTTPGVTSEHYSFDIVGLGRAAAISGSSGGISIITKTGDESPDTTTYGFNVGMANFGGASLKSIADPTDPQDAANKRWVEQLVSQGTHIIAAVRAATTGNVDSLSGTKTIDGVALDEGDRVLVRVQGPTENGVYIVNSGAWTKLPDDSDKGSLVTVLEGTTQKRRQYYNQDGTAWVLYWVDDDYYATVNGGLELHANGFGFGIKSGGVTNAMLAGSIDTDKLASMENEGSLGWGQISPPGVASSLINKLSDIFSAIRLLRGTPSFITSNTESIGDAYDKIALKNSLRYGTVVPDGNPGGADGDIFLKRLT